MRHFANFLTVLLFAGVAALIVLSHVKTIYQTDAASSGQQSPVGTGAEVQVASQAPEAASLPEQTPSAPENEAIASTAASEAASEPSADSMAQESLQIESAASESEPGVGELPVVTALDPETKTGMLYIGDERLPALAAYDQEDSIFLYRDGADLNFLIDEAIPMAEQAIEEGGEIVVLLGLHDLINENGYVSTLNDWGAKLKEEKNVTLYYASVNPTADTETNSQIEGFNTNLNRRLGNFVLYLNTYPEMRDGGVSFTEGILYDDATNENLFEVLHGLIEGRRARRMAA